MPQRQTCTSRQVGYDGAWIARTEGGLPVRQLPPIAPVSAEGTLGLVHMPRMWSKALLHATGQLAEGYRTGCFFDRTVMSGLGIDPQEAIAYLTSELPSYQDFEAWVLAKVGGHIPAETIDKINRTILEHELDEDSLRAFQEELGLPAGSPVRKTARLDELDDLVQFHRLLITP
jgi:hypothetical protein